MHRRVRVLPFALLWLAAASSAQEEAAGAEELVPPLVEEAERIAAALSGHRLEGERVRALLAEAEGDDAEALRRHLEENGLAYMRELARFVDNLLARERAGLDTTESRAKVDEQMRPLGRRIHEVVLEAEESLASLRSRQEELPPEEREALQDRIARRADWLDAAYQSLAQYARALERLGFAPESERAFLTERLTERAVLLNGRVRLGRERVASLEEKSEAAPGDAALEEELRLARRKLEVATRSLRSSVALMGDLGLETTESRQLLVETTGEIALHQVDRELVGALLRDWWDRGRETLREAAPAITTRLLRFALVLALFWLLARLTRVLVRRGVSSSRLKTSLLLQNMLMGLASKAVMTLGILLGLSQIGVELAPLLAGLGIAGFIIGFALQDTLSNFASGAMILIYRPFDVGDVVHAGGVFGRVRDMSLVSTTLLTFDNETLVVPNSKIWGDVIRNLTSQSQRRVDLTVRVGNDEDVERILGILSEVVAKHPKTLAEPAPIIQVNELSEAGVVFAVRPWAETGDYWDVYWDLTRQIKQRFDREGIPIPMHVDYLRGRRDDGSG